MAEPQKYDRAAAFEMLKQEHGEYASPELINKELDSFEKELGISSSKPVPADAAAPPIDVATPNTQLEVSPRDQLNTTSSAREQLNAITSSGEDRTTPVNDALSAFSKLSTKEQLLYGGGAAALTALGAKKAGEIAVQGVAKLKDRFFGADAKPPINAGVNPAMSPATTDTGLKLSPIDQQILDRANINTQVRQEYLNRTLGTTDPVSEAVAQTPEQIRQAKLVAASQAAQQSMVAAPVNTALQPVVPTAAEEAMNRARTSQGFTGENTANQLFMNVAKERQALPPSVPPEVAPVAAPVEVAPALVKAAPETPKNTNEKILETINKVAPKVETTTAESSLGKPDVKTGSGMSAYQGQGEEGGKVVHKKGTINSLKDVPKNMVFVPGGQNMDIVRNAVGQPEYTKNLKSSGGYPASPQAAYEASRNINQSLGRTSMAEAKASGTPLPEPTQSITQKIAGSKTVRVGGVTGALILATDLASAATMEESLLKNMAEGFKDAVKNKDYGMAASQAAQLLNFHPYTFLANELFGSSPEELQILRQADQARKAKAGNSKSTGK